MNGFLQEIVSGGQTGAVRAALDFAIAHAFRTAAGVFVAGRPRMVAVLRC
jgi:hypothetical protein